MRAGVGAGWGRRGGGRSAAVDDAFSVGLLGGHQKGQCVQRYGNMYPTGLVACAYIQPPGMCLREEWDVSARNMSRYPAGMTRRIF